MAAVIVCTDWPAPTRPGTIVCFRSRVSIHSEDSSTRASSASGTTRKPCLSAWMSWPGLTVTPKTCTGTSQSVGIPPKPCPTHTPRDRAWKPSAAISSRSRTPPSTKQPTAPTARKYEALTSPHIEPRMRGLSSSCTTIIFGKCGGSDATWSRNFCLFAAMLAATALSPGRTLQVTAKPTMQPICGMWSITGSRLKHSRP
mmetsp:Transcript_30187/g.49983  ORF Transcript_30187/g.49983 Transcript_30187/m.49983 type:complete len:200 (+) Transcript_30187:267-866(+)